LPIYEYKAFGPGGAAQAGVVDADTEREARQKLRREELLVSQLKELRSGRHARSESTSGPKHGLLSRIARSRAMHSGPGSREIEIVAAVTRQLSVLLASGIALAEALKAIIEQSQQRRVETMFREVRERIQQGASLADALKSTRLVQ
jgi:general secretion pathway protein F